MDGESYMLDTIKENLLIPIIEKFERGFPETLQINQIINILKYNQIPELITYQPNSDTVCSHPYEINTKEGFEHCELNGNWNRYNHFEISSLDEEKTFTKNNIKLRTLTDRQISDLEKKLKYHNY